MAFRPTSPIRTYNAAATREADLLVRFWPSNPQAMTVYLRFIETGTVESTTLSTQALFELGSTSVNPRFIVFANGAGFYAVLHNNGMGGSRSASALVAPAYGDLVEIVATLNPDGSVSITQTINGVTAAIVTSAGGALVFSPSGWATRRAFVGNGTQMILNLRNCVVDRGVKDTTQMRRRAGVI